MRKSLFVIALLFIAPIALAQVAVTGNLKDLGANNATSQTTYVLFALQNYGGNIPRVTGTNAFVSSVSPPFYPNASGVIGGNIQPNDTITPTGTYYQVCIFNAGVSQWCQNFQILSSQNPWNLNSASPISTNPTAPSQVLGARSFVFTQASAATTWTVTHNFNDIDVETQCFNSSGTLIAPASGVTMTITNANTVTVTYGSSQSGTCVVMDGSQQVLVSPVGNAIVGNPTASQTITQPAGTTLTLPGMSNAALKPQASDAIQYVSINGNNVNDGLSAGTAKGGADVLTAINAAIVALPSGKGTVQLLGGVFSTASAAIPIPSGVCIAGLGRDVTTIKFSVAGNGLQINPNTTFACVHDLTIEYTSSASLASTGIDFSTNPTSVTQHNSFYNLHIKFDAFATGSAGIFINGQTGANTSLNSFYNILIENADQMIVALFSEGNTFTDLQGINLGNTANQQIVVDNSGTDNVYNGVRIESGSSNVGPTTCFSASSSGLRALITCDSSLATTAINDTGGNNIFNLAVVGTGSNISLGSIAASSHLAVIALDDSAVSSKAIFPSVTTSILNSSSANPAQSGIFRMATGDSINWRNNANNADISLGKNSSDNLTYPNSLALGSLTSGNCVQAGTGGLLTTTAGACGSAMGSPQTSAATNFGVNLSTQTVVASVPATGNVFIFSGAVLSTVGVGCTGATNNTVTGIVSFTEPGGTVSTFGIQGMTFSGNGTLDLGASSNTPTVITAKAGTAITYTASSTLGSTGCTTTPQYTVYAKAIF